jgi:hypothetical protein
LKRKWELQIGSLALSLGQSSSQIEIDCSWMVECKEAPKDYQSFRSPETDEKLHACYFLRKRFLLQITFDHELEIIYKVSVLSLDMFF